MLYSNGIEIILAWVFEEGAPWNQEAELDQLWSKLRLADIAVQTDPVRIRSCGRWTSAHAVARVERRLCRDDTHGPRTLIAETGR